MQKDLVLSFLIYMTSFSISIYFSYLYQKKLKLNSNLSLLNKSLYYILIISPVVIISTFRYNVGTDFNSYQLIYEQHSHMNYFQMLETSIWNNEPLFLLLMRISTIIFSNVMGFFFLSSILTHVILINAFEYFNKYVSLPFALFISYMMHFSYGLNITRQMIAISVVFFSLKYMEQKKFGKYLLTVIIASLFHNTALFMLIFLLIPVNIKKRNWEYNLGLFLILLLSPILLDSILDTVTQLEIPLKYMSFFYEDPSLGFGFLKDIVPFLAPLFVLSKSYYIKEPFLKKMLLLSLFNIPFYSLVYFAAWGERMALYSNLALYILIPYFIKSLPTREMKMTYTSYFTLLFFAQYIFRFLIMGYSEVYPFQFI